MKSTQRGIQSVEVAGQILRIVVEQARPMVLKEIAELMEMPSAQVFTYLVSLSRVGMLKKNPYTQTFEPGPLAFRLGISALHSQPRVREAMPLLDELGQRLALNVFIAVWSRHGPTVVRYVEHGTVLNLGFRLGDILPLTTTATGRLFSAFQPATICEEVIRARTFTRDSLEVYQSEQFQQELEEIRGNRFSMMQGIPTPAASAFSAPVFSADGELLLAVSVFGASAEFNGQRIVQVIDALRSVSDALSES